MKTLSIKSLVFLLAATLTFFTSCNKDEDVVGKEVIDANVVGEWNVTGGNAAIYDAGYFLLDVDLSTAGTMTFDNDGTGYSDFTMDFGGETETAKGSFTWEEDGFELLITQDGVQERWAQVDDEKNLQTLQYTHVDEDDPDLEVEITLTLVRK